MKLAEQKVTHREPKRARNKWGCDASGGFLGGHSLRDREEVSTRQIGVGIITLSDNENACQKLDATHTAARRSRMTHAHQPSRRKRKRAISLAI